MNILIDITHPGDIHLFRNFSKAMESKGHNILYTTRNKGVSLELLEQYKMPYRNLGKHYKSILGKIYGMFKYNFILYKISKTFTPDLYLSMGSLYAAQVSYLRNKPHITFDDTEHVSEQHILYAPFSDAILNPTSFHKKYGGKKQLFYHGYHELAYLYPGYFQPDETILAEMGLQKGEKFTIVRFVEWDASHDYGEKGMNAVFKNKLVKNLLEYGKVFISSESTDLGVLETYRLKIPSKKMLDALAFSSLYIGEGATVASEAACLGIPSIYINSLEVGYLTELEANYDLVFNFRNPSGVIDKAIEILSLNDIKGTFTKRKQKMMDDKIDVSAFMEWFVEYYPDSFKLMKTDPSIQFKLPRL